jgi:peroxiredoxin Q/BCP
MIKTGDPIPQFALKDQEGKEFSISELIGKKPFVVYFYPKDDTPGCTAEACSFRDQYEDFTSIGAEVIGISSDSPESHKNFIRKYNLPFSLLSDPDNSIRKKFGVPAGFFGLVPGRVTFVCDRNGTVQYVFNSQMNVRKHVKEALRVLDQFVGSN